MTTDVQDPHDPKTVVSIVPSDTYTLIRLGVGERIVGRTEYCLEPSERVAEIPVVGGTKNVDVAAVVAMAPDLVIANQEENRRKDIEELRAAGVSVLLSFPKTVEEGLEHTRRLAALFPTADVSQVAVAAERLARLSASNAAPVPTFVPIWMDPLMTVHHDTFISDAIELCGGRNVFSDRKRRYPLSADLGRRPAALVSTERDTRYPRVTLQEIAERRPQLVLLPDEPHAFTEADAAVFRDCLPDAVVRFCDGKDLMWPGLRALEGLDRIAGLISPV